MGNVLFNEALKKSRPSKGKKSLILFTSRTPDFGGQMMGKKKLKRSSLNVSFILISKEKRETRTAATEPWAQQTHHSHNSLFWARYGIMQHRDAQALNAGSAGSNVLPDRSYCSQRI